MKLIPLVILTILFTSLPAFSQSEVSVHVKNMIKLRTEGKYEEAIAEISKAIAIQPGNSGLFFERASIYQLTKDLTALNADVERAIALDPNNHLTVSRASALFLNTRQCDKAEEFLDAYIARTPQSAQAYYFRSGANSCLKDFTTAFNDISTAIELIPDNSLYRSSQADLLSQMGDSESALEAFKSIINSLELRLSNPRTPDEKKWIERDLAMTYDRRSWIFRRAKKTDSAIADLTKAIELQPDSRYYLGRGLLYKDAKMYDDAIKDFTNAIAANKGNGASTYLFRADVYMLTGDYTKAIADYETALKGPSTIKPLIESKLAAAKQKLNENREQ